MKQTPTVWVDLSSIANQTMAVNISHNFPSYIVLFVLLKININSKSTNLRNSVARFFASAAKGAGNHAVAPTLPARRAAHAGVLGIQHYYPARLAANNWVRAALTGVLGIQHFYPARLAANNWVRAAQICSLTLKFCG